jgi:hypothetical protein
MYLDNVSQFNFCSQKKSRINSGKLDFPILINDFTILIQFSPASLR